MLDLAVLGLLREGPRHGYELKRQLSEYGFWQVSFGSLYPALRRLEKGGLIEAARMSGRRKEYRTTADGEAEFRRLLEDESGDIDEDRAFQLRLAFFRYLDPETRLGLLERRRARMVEKLYDAKRSMKRSGAKAKERMDRYTIALIERGVHSAESDIAWLDDLIAAERDEQEEPLTTRRKNRPGTALGGAEGGNAWAK
jgi:DNA-binding PadR family transcriptional regulator